MKNLHGINLIKLTGPCTNRCAGKTSNGNDPKCHWSNFEVWWNNNINSWWDYTKDLDQFKTPRKTMVYWWLPNKENKNRKMAELQLGKHPTSDNLSNFRILREKARRTVKQNRRTSWCKFVSKLNCHTPMTKVWNMMQKIKGKNIKTNVHHWKLDRHFNIWPGYLK